MLPSRPTLALLLALFTPAALFIPAAVSAATGVVDWPTYLRAGPGKQFAVLQELARGVILELGDCSNQWCSVRVDRVAGYVDRTALGDKASISPLTAPAPAANCFDSRRNGYENGEAFRYCPR